jgi:hypothetical protein
MPSFSFYLPSVFAIILAWIFIAVPQLAVLLVAGLLIGFAIFYAVLITKLSKLTKDARNSFDNAPTFKQVTVQMFEKGGTWFKNPPGS